MFLGLAILLNSFLPVDLVARILPPDITIAENTPAGTIVGPLVHDADGDSKLEIVAAIPQGIFGINEQSSELSVVDPTSLDFESLRQVVLVVRETREKRPDPYRSLFVNKLLRDGAQPHQMTRFTADTYYHLRVIEITDVEDTPPLDRASNAIPIGEDNANPDGRSPAVDSHATDTIAFLMLTRQSVKFDDDQIAVTQAYLDRRRSRAVAREIGDRSPVAADVTSESQTASVQEKTPNMLPQAVAAIDGETTAAVTGALVDETLVAGPIERVNGNPRFDTSPKSSSSDDRPRSALWWLVAALVASLVSACVILLSQTLYQFEQTHGFLRRFLTSVETQQEVSFVEDEVIDASPDVYELLDESDLRMLESRETCISTQDVAQLMQSCLSELDAPSESRHSKEFVQVAAAGQSLAASSMGLNDDMLSEADFEKLESVSTPSDEVERLRNLIRNEFGIESPTSHNSQPSLPLHSSEVMTSHDYGTNPETSQYSEIDLNDFRHIADAACHHAIRTARIKLRNRRVRGLLMSASLGCSLVCGLAAIFLVSNENGRSLLVSMAIMSLLGYMLSRRQADEPE